MPLRIGLREIGAVLLLLSLGLAYLLVSFVNTLAELSTESCTCGDTCDMVHFEIPTSFYLGAAGIVVLLLISLIFVVKGGTVFTQQASLDQWKKTLASLKGDEKRIYQELVDGGGAVFQSELAEKTGLSKVKVTRILDGLEARKLAERKRRGMTNVVVLK